MHVVWIFSFFVTSVKCKLILLKSILNSFWLLHLFPWPKEEVFFPPK